jgi:hypothetical protein
VTTSVFRAAATAKKAAFTARLIAKEARMLVTGGLPGEC